MLKIDYKFDKRYLTDNIELFQIVVLSSFYNTFISTIVASSIPMLLILCDIYDIAYHESESNGLIYINNHNIQDNERVRSVFYRFILKYTENYMNKMLQTNVLRADITIYGAYGIPVGSISRRREAYQEPDIKRYGLSLDVKDFNQTIDFEEYRCLSCKEYKKDVIFVPCGHYIVCSICAYDMKKCMKCDLKIQTMQKVYE
jgi:hypothetical protein